ncbi:MAG: flagellar hook capping FlgD N-terminal domain-containing protein [bacterium]
MLVQNTLTDITNNTKMVNAEKAKTRMGSSNMDQDAFLQLLMQQMQNQDPMEPTKNEQFIQQTAQFTQISELQKLNKNQNSSNQIMQASALIGKEVTMTDPDNPNSTIKGVVSEAQIDSKGANLLINNKAYPMNLVQSIK